MTNTIKDLSWRWALGSLLALVLTLSCLVGVGARSALALPPGGASSNTPGTTSSISPTTVSPGDTLTFTVGGFPAGETVYVKIDDGVSQGYDTSQQGTGVVAQATIDSNGNASGSITIPTTLANGQHWLRFLASKLIDPTGEKADSEGYTHKSDYFTVTDSAGTAGVVVTTTATAGSGGQSAPSEAEVATAGSETTDSGADLGTVTTDASGNATLETSLSASLVNGQYTIRATQGSNEADAVLAIGASTELPTAPSSSGEATLSVNGASAAQVEAGDSLTLQVSGFDPNSEVTFSLLSGVAGQDTTIVQEAEDSGVSPLVLTIFIVVVAVALLAILVMVVLMLKSKKQTGAGTNTKPTSASGNK